MAMTVGIAAPGSLSIAEAVALIRRYPIASGVEQVDVAAGVGRILAEDVVAGREVPGHSGAAMDGYAFRYADLTGEHLPVQARVTAGHPLGDALLPGHAVRIFTGAAVPAGADTVAMQEDCVAEGGSVRLPVGIARGAHCRLAGEDIARGATVLAAGTRIRPQDVGIATAVGRAALAVRTRLRVAVVATGDELRPPGEELPPGCIHDTNRHTVKAALRALGAQVDDRGIVRDRQELIRDAFVAAASRNDLIISTGGVSAGDEDHVRPAIEEIGSLGFWRLPIKPGKPVAVGEALGVPVLGLPGNPVAAMVAFWVVGRALVLHLMGAQDIDLPRYQVVAGFAHRRTPGRREFLRARLRTDADGVVHAEAFFSAGSGMLSSLTWSDGLVEIPEGEADVQVGDLVRYIPYSALER